MSTSLGAILSHRSAKRIEEERWVFPKEYKSNSHDHLVRTVRRNVNGKTFMIENNSQICIRVAYHVAMNDALSCLHNVTRPVLTIDLHVFYVTYSCAVDAIFTLSELWPDVMAFFTIIPSLCAL
jgi:hypothetical protein